MGLLNRLFGPPTFTKWREKNPDVSANEYSRQFRGLLVDIAAKCPHIRFYFPSQISSGLKCDIHKDSDHRCDYLSRGFCSHGKYSFGKWRFPKKDSD